VPIIEVQKRLMELGRVRLGEKGPKGEPRKLSTLRFTSASRALLEAIAAQHGGQVTVWTGAPDEGFFQVTTEATEIDIVLPPVFSDADGTPTVAYSQWMELWSGGGCLRRCDGVTEALSGKDCICAEEGKEERACKPTTRVSFMLPDIPGLGVWRLDSHGWNAATELPVTLEVLSQAAAANRFIPAVLRLQNRTKKTEGQTRRFVVPVIDLKDITVKQLASGEVPEAIAMNPPTMTAIPKPALPAASTMPAAEPFTVEFPNPDLGPPPPPPTHGAPQPVDSPSGSGSDTADTSVSRLTAELMEAAKDRGVADKTLKLIQRNLRDHADEPEKHVVWLERQLARMREEVPA
jgi:TusA-related sulfurtransferase